MLPCNEQVFCCVGFGVMKAKLDLVIVKVAEGLATRSAVVRWHY